ncbi:hypothetical protein Micbo1qcDRAFT_161100 [Microdochium bolleyi]|uniref:ER membrane protein complex subunit 2 n=1 Tax=Microdochium bolleyi TaxID=196109 RepID=A0A136J7Z3_9PEZI|nr:hypothetical protein Micbo1qcDRAFT_161100 [Microdochium bolleyi]
MTSYLLHPPSHLPPATALQHSQQAPGILENSAGSLSPSLIQSLLGAPETAELWTTYENLLLSCLRTGDDQAAHQCLGRLVNRFGDKHERIQALIGLVKEAEAPDRGTLEAILEEYDQTLRETPTNISIAKRRVGLLKSMNRIPDAILALTGLLDFCPTDAESWAELSDLYFSQGLYAQAIFALEEVVVLQPNAWNIHARLGELLYIAGKSGAQGTSPKQLNESLKRFSRSIELCDDYLRGYYGLKLVTTLLLQQPPNTKSSSSEADDLAPPTVATIQKLDAKATEKLAEIARRSSAQEPGWQGYDADEVAAVKELLAASSSTGEK